MHLSKRPARWLPTLGLLTAVVVCSFLLLAPARSRITEANCDKIQEGMTQREVEAILGGPPGDYATRPYNREIGMIVGLHLQNAEDYVSKEWIGDEGIITIEFYKDGTVVWTDWRPFRQPDIWDRMEQMRDYLRQRLALP